MYVFNHTSSYWRTKEKSNHVSNFLYLKENFSFFILIKTRELRSYKVDPLVLNKFYLLLLFSFQWTPTPDILQLHSRISLCWYIYTLFQSWALNLRQGFVMKPSIGHRVSRNWWGNFVYFSIFLLRNIILNGWFSFWVFKFLNVNLHKCEDSKQETREFCLTILY